MKSEPDKAVEGTEAAAVHREEVCSAAMARRIAAMLDLAPEAWASEPAVLPRGWHFTLLAADTRRSELRADGFPGLGVPMPNLALPRLMLGGRTVAFAQDIPMGALVRRTSAVRNVTHKNTSSGPMAVVTLAHDLFIEGHVEPALAETQTYLLLPARAVASGDPTAAAPAAETESPVRAMHQKNLQFDETLLFQYSALGFNSHRIHLDRDHARDVEGFPDLVVNGGLSTLMLTEFLRRELKVRPAAISVRHHAPLFCHRPVTLTADPLGPGWRLKALDEHRRVAVDMEVTVQ